MGYWLSPEGKAYPNPDHYQFILSHPALFRMKKKDLRGGVADRQPTIDLAIAGNWIRVRGTRPHLSFEFAVLDQRTIWNVKEFLIRQKIDPTERILFEEAATGASWYEPASWVLEDTALMVARNPKRKRRLAFQR